MQWQPIEMKAQRAGPLASGLSDAFFSSKAVLYQHTAVDILVTQCTM
jgi:hypothetical protein